MNKMAGFVSLKILNKTCFNQVTYGFKFSKHVYCVLQFFSSCFLIPCVPYYSKHVLVFMKVVETL